MNVAKDSYKMDMEKWKGIKLVEKVEGKKKGKIAGMEIKDA